MKKRGTRLEVWNSKAEKTAGGLSKDDLFERNGRIISKKCSELGKKNKKRLKQFAFKNKE